MYKLDQKVGLVFAFSWTQLSFSSIGFTAFPVKTLWDLESPPEGNRNRGSENIMPWVNEIIMILYIIKNAVSVYIFCLLVPDFIFIGKIRKLNRTDL